MRERFEERGYILPRIGKPPKRAIPFRTADPFAKITANLIAADGSTGEKIEFMCDGQQIVAAGIHPDTGKPYAWPLGNPTDIAHDDLPDISEAEAQQLVDDIVELLCRDFGYSRAAGRPARKGNGAQPGAAAGDWQQLVDDILAGNELHANTRDLAAKMVRGGTDGGAIVNFLRGLMNSSAAPRDERWQHRYDNLPRQVDSMQEKIEREQALRLPCRAGHGDRSRRHRHHHRYRPGAGPAPAAAPAPGSSSPIEDTLQVFERWLILPSRRRSMPCSARWRPICCAGDPVWLGLVAPPSSAKTEIAQRRLRGCRSWCRLDAHAGGPAVGHAADGSERGGQRRAAAPGRQSGPACLKDFTSILTMRPDGKAEMLGALREIYDGQWSAVIGTDGGRAGAGKASSA